MRQRPFGTTGVSLPVIGQGTWNLERDDPDEALRALRRGLELGLTHVDTAELYGSGRVEELVGRALAGWRGELFVTSKVLPTNATRAGTIAACERSLARLGRESLDLYLLHWPGPHPLEETLAAFAELRAAGKARFTGVSNFDAAGLDRAVRLAGAGNVVCDQVLYHLGERAAEHRVLGRCRAHGAALVGYSPFGSSAAFPPGGTAARATLEAVAARRGATARQVALAFLTRDPAAFAIPKAGRAAHVEENAAAAELALDAEDLRALEQAFPLGPEPRELPTI